MGRLVVVSNRLPSLRTDGPANEPGVPVGGLASALLGALRRNPGSLWFGWNGRVAEAQRTRRVSRALTANVELAGMPLTRSELEEYYLGFCNETLWPAFHSFQGRVRIQPQHWERYCSVQSLFAYTLLPMLQPNDTVWVHDYHLLLLGDELRRLGFTGRLGFFLHIPFPPYEMWNILPQPRETLRAMLQYDVVGFHIQTFVDSYVYACRRLLGARCDGSMLHADGRAQRVGAYPVGIDPDDFRPPLQRTTRGKRREVLHAVLRDRELVLGVDRLDYSKGIPERIEAYERFLKTNPQWHKKVIYLQIASPSRAELSEYAHQKAMVESLMGRINGELGEHDWQPARYLYKTYRREFLARLYREADVALVTPLRDGMNLVAKEFVAAQDPGSPGVLVLSSTAGAAEELSDAILVNPYDIHDVARGIERALSMPLEERIGRHSSMLATVRAQTATVWANSFLRDLYSALEPEHAWHSEA